MLPFIARVEAAVAVVEEDEEMEREDERGVAKIDAALDEYNQGVVAKLVATYFKRSQVICISHHPAFHQAGHVIQIDKDPKTNSSALQKIISRRQAAS
jgi:hypothetical protein